MNKESITENWLGNITVGNFSKDSISKAVDDGIEEFDIETVVREYYRILQVDFNNNPTHEIVDDAIDLLKNLRVVGLTN